MTPPKPDRPARPTEAELEILRALWRLGPSPVRAVHAELARTREVGPTTVLKLMQIMVEKGLLVRDEDVRPQRYRPAKPRRQMQRALLRDLMERAFEGSPGDLVLQALSSRKASAEELREIRALLDRLEGEEGAGR